MSDVDPALPPVGEDAICVLTVDGETFEVRVSGAGFDHAWRSGPGVGPGGFTCQKSDGSPFTLTEHVTAIREFLEAARRDIAEGGYPES